MKKVVTLDRYEAFLQVLQAYHEKKDSVNSTNLILVFMANDDAESGQSWCPDCAKAKPIIDEVLQNFDHFDVGYVLVGPRDEWKKDDNPYRLHALKVTNVPTVINMRNNTRLVESECFDRDKLRNLVNNSK
jgi:thiol-disulfide isomerase/thioredoxin